MDSAEKIKSFFKGEVHTEAEVLESHSRDASLLKVMPKVVVFPKDADDISNLVKFVVGEKASDASLSITARAAGTCMSGGSLNESIILDVSKFMQGVKEVGADFATTLPGTFYRDFEKATLAKGLIMPSFPASKNLCAVGGMVANNAGGERSLAYGK
ncbi:MAG: FAD-binding oxidoreductase, partial [Patescibacteria group bacterium]